MPHNFITEPLLRCPVTGHHPSFEPCFDFMDDGHEMKPRDCICSTIINNLDSLLRLRGIEIAEEDEYSVAHYACALISELDRPGVLEKGLHWLRDPESDGGQIPRSKELAELLEAVGRFANPSRVIKPLANGMPDYLQQLFQRHRYSVDEMQQMLGQDMANGLAAHAAKNQSEAKAVRAPRYIKPLTALPSPEEKEAGRQRWNTLKKRFPMEDGGTPLLIRNVCADHKGGGFIAQTFANTWRNPSNAQNHRRKIGYHLTPRLQEHVAAGGTWYTRSFPSEVWTAKCRESFSQKIRRRGEKWIAFDNSTEFGEIPVLSSVALDDQWVEVHTYDLFDLVTGWLDAIWPRVNLAKGVPQPHYFWGSDNLASGLTNNPDAISDKANLIGILPIGRTTDAELAAALTAFGGRTYYRRMIWKTQIGETLQIEKVPPECIAQVVAQFSGTLTAFGRSLLGAAVADREVA